MKQIAITTMLFFVVQTIIVCLPPIIMAQSSGVPKGTVTSKQCTVNLPDILRDYLNGQGISQQNGETIYYGSFSEVLAILHDMQTTISGNGTIPQHQSYEIFYTVNELCHYEWEYQLLRGGLYQLPDLEQMLEESLGCIQRSNSGGPIILGTNFDPPLEYYYHVLCIVIPICDDGSQGIPLEIELEHYKTTNIGDKGAGIIAYVEDIEDEVWFSCDHGNITEDCLDTYINDDSFLKSNPNTPLTQPLHYTVAPTLFDQNITLSYTLPQDQEVALNLYTINGQQVAQLIPPVYQPTGYYQQAFDVSHLPTGAYYYQLSVGEQVFNGKLMKMQ